MNIIKKKEKHIVIARALLFSIGVMLSCNSFAEPKATQAALNIEISARMAGDNTLQDQINDLPVPSVYEIGDILGDGSIVFFVDDSREHGLAAWPEDEVRSVDWYVAGQDSDRHGFRWHLPTGAELVLLYNARNVVGGLSESPYWGSTEYGPNGAGLINFGNSHRFADDKYRPAKVRAVRAF